MGDLLIRDISDAMKANLASLAEQTDTSLSDAAKLALAEGIEAARRKSELAADEIPFGDRLRAMFGGIFETNEEAEAFHDEIETERKADFGRPLPDLE